MQSFAAVASQSRKEAGAAGCRGDGGERESERKARTSRVLRVAQPQLAAILMCRMSSLGMWLKHRTSAVVAILKYTVKDSELQFPPASGLACTLPYRAGWSISGRLWVNNELEDITE